MEYPMFTAITGQREPSSLLGVIAHELAHEWFYGMVATDEMAFAWMDEGFVDFIETEAIASIFGGALVDHAHARRDIITLDSYGLYQPPNTFANDFKTDRGYFAAAYDGGRALLDLLGYVIGDEVRDEVLRAYVERFRFRHPTPDDLRAVAEELSGQRLDWLFGPFLDEGVRYDYGIAALLHTAGGTTITLQRYAPGLLPVSVQLVYDDGTIGYVSVPVAEAGGHRAVPKPWTVAAPWPAQVETYTLTVEGAVRDVQLDPTGRMFDYDRTNNRLARDG